MARDTYSPYSPQQAEVLRLLEYYPVISARKLEDETGYPPASVRRVVQELRRCGHSISHDQRVYRYFGLTSVLASA